MSELTDPHDRFFQEIFGRPEQAVDLLQLYLPATVAAVLDPDPASLVLQAATFVDADLRRHSSDLVFEARLKDGGSAVVYVLFEHKSRPEPLVSFQVLRYLVRLWARDLRAGRPLLPVIPVVVYHGQARWRVARNFGALYAGPEALRPYWPEYRYALVDVSRRGAAELRGEVVTRVALELLRAIFDPRLAEELPRILALLGELRDSATVTELLRTMLVYVAASSDVVTVADLDAAVEGAGTGAGGEMVTTLMERLMEQGREQGLDQGRREGLLAGIELALEVKFGTAGLALVPEIAAIPDSATLTAVRDAIRTASSPAEVRRVYADADRA